MDKFKKMMQVAKIPGRLRPNIGDEHLKVNAMENFLDACKQNEVFLLEEPNKKLPEKQMNWGDYQIDAPFEIFSFEYENDYNICSSAETDEMQCLTECIMVQELEVDQTYRFYALVYIPSEDYRFVAITENKKYYSNLMNYCLKKLNSSFCGQETVKQVVSFKDKKKKQSVKINRQFIVCGSQSRKKHIEYKKRDIEWNHNTSVRGHWRRQFCKNCKGSGCDPCDNIGLRKDFLGLNRKGERIIPGKTWVQHYGENVAQKIRKVKA